MTRRTALRSSTAAAGLLGAVTLGGLTAPAALASSPHASLAAASTNHPTTVTVNAAGSTSSSHSGRAGIAGLTGLLGLFGYRKYKAVRTTRRVARPDDTGDGIRRRT